MCDFSWRRRAGVAILGFSVSFASAVTAASNDPLTLAEAQRLATVQSEKITASDYTRVAAEELQTAAGQSADPVLRFGFDNVPVTGPNRFNINNDFMTMTRVGVMQEFTRSAKRRLRSERASLSVAMAQANHDMTLATVQRETALAWFNSYYSQQQYDLMAQQLASMREAIVAAESAYAQGRGSSTEALAVRGMAGQVEDQFADTGNRMRTARIGLARWIGDAAQRPLTARPAIDTLPLHAHQDVTQLEAQLKEHPDILLLDRQLEVAQTEAQLARAERQSDWSVEVSYGRRGPQFDDMISLGVSIPLQLNRDGRQNREFGSRLATASAAKAQRDDMYREHVAEVRSLLDAWNTTRERHSRYQTELLPLAQDRIVAAEAAYRGGKSNLQEVIAAHRNRIDVSLQSLQLESEVARLWAELSFLSATRQNESGEQR
jgi:outer membrane protein TolC